MIIYAPVLESVPAFCCDADETTVYIKINYKHNRAVQIVNNTGIRLRIMTMNNGESLIQDSDKKALSIRTTVISLQNNNNSFSIPLSSFTVPMVEGQYYKFQIAYDDDITPQRKTPDANLAWSSVAIGRYIGKQPTFYLVGLQDDPEEEDRAYKSAQVQYIGEYRHDFETLYKYKIEIEGIDSTGWQIYNESVQMQLTSGKALQANLKYKVTFSIITINGYEGSISKWVEVDAATHTLAGAKLEAIPNQENGYIDIVYTGYGEEKKLTQSNYLLLRSENLRDWEEIVSFYASAEVKGLDSFLLYRDYTIEQGSVYYYALQEFTYWPVNQWTNFQSGTKFISNGAQANFEHIILSDADRTLVVEYNPKVSSYKNTILEGKTDTIGSKYPFFFRNGDVKYKEIPISGLISYQMDEEHLFMSEEELGLSSVDWSTNLTGDNIAAERKFKNAVLDWLNNGQPKILRTPTEGNFIVRIMQVSLSPNDTLGRMLHTFQATAYECADFTQENLRNMNLLSSFSQKGFEQQSELTEVWMTEEYTREFPYIATNVHNITLYQTIPNTQADVLRLIPDKTENAFNIKNYSGIYKTDPDVEFKVIECWYTEGTDTQLSFYTKTDLVYGTTNRYIYNQILRETNSWGRSGLLCHSVTTTNNSFIIQPQYEVYGLYLTGVYTNNSNPLVELYYEGEEKPTSIYPLPGEPIYLYGDEYSYNRNGAKLTQIKVANGAQADIFYSTIWQEGN